MNATRPADRNHRIDKDTFAYRPLRAECTSRTIGSTTHLSPLYDCPKRCQKSRAAQRQRTSSRSISRQCSLTTSKMIRSLLDLDAARQHHRLVGSTVGRDRPTSGRPFRHDHRRAGTASENATQYAGQEDEGSGIYYDRARFYSPAAARFLSQDPTGQAGSGPNLYLYTNDNPINAVDPYGTTACYAGTKGESLSSDTTFTHCRNIEEAEKKEEELEREKIEEEAHKNFRGGGGVVMAVIQPSIDPHCNGSPEEWTPGEPTPDTPPPQPVPGWGPSLPSYPPPLSAPEPALPGGLLP